MGTGKVFISHAVDDKPLAEAMADLIEAGIGLSHDQVFCTSLAGQGIPAGKDFKNHIQSELASSVIVIALLTPNYYASAFCLCELGGTWMLSKDFLPFVTPLAGYSDLKAVLKGVQALKVDVDTDLDEMRDRLSSIAKSPTPTPRWSAKRSKFLQMLPGIIKKLPKPKILTASEAKKLADERDGYMAESQSLESELDKIKVKYEALGKLKDKAAVREIELKFSDEQDKLKALIKDARQALKPLSRGVQEALFYRSRGDDWYPNEDWSGRLDDDIERGVLRLDSDGIVDVNSNHPKIRPAIAALARLEKFVDKATSDFSKAYEEEYEDVLSFEARGFWERHLID